MSDDLARLRLALEEAQARAAKATAERDELLRKLAAAHAELMRRHRRDQELARHLPAMAARLTAIAADCQEPEPAPMPLEDVVDQDGW